jgi:hypothetical protein
MMIYDPSLITGRPLPVPGSVEISSHFDAIYLFNLSGSLAKWLSFIL